MLTNTTGVEPTIYHPPEHANHYTTDVVFQHVFYLQILSVPSTTYPLKQIMEEDQI
jgi:hypothetical protein